MQAITTTAGNGDRYLTLSVAFENIGSAPIYVTGGCGSGLTSSIVTNSAVIQKAAGPLCACAEFIMTLNPGQNHTAITPGCWSGYNYKVVGSGSLSANLTLAWYGGKNLQNVNSTSIAASLTVG